MILYLFSVFRAVPVKGRLDDLLSQQMFIYYSLLLKLFGITLLFIIYVLNNIFLHNKYLILRRFNHKLIRFYIQYQVLLAKFSLFVFGPL